MKVNELLDLIPAGLLDELAATTRVNRHVKKLSGQTIFKLALFAMLNSHKTSLRVMEHFLHSATVRVFTDQTYASDDQALTELIHHTAGAHTLVFDRGLAAGFSFVCAESA